MVQKAKERAVFAPATREDAAELAAHMRAADRMEVALMHGLTPLEGACLALDVSDVAFSARVGGRLHCLFGALRESLLDGTACAWMLCTDEPSRRPRAFAAGCREGFRILSAALPDVETWLNSVPCGFSSDIRWLEWAGARFAPPSENISGRCGGLFMRFSINAVDAAKEGPWA